MQDFHKEFEYAKDVILEAGEFVGGQLGKKQRVDVKESIQQIVTETDIKTEELMRSRLVEAFLDYGFIGEEGEILEKDTAWVIDPIDGTIGFERNLPSCAVVLGLKYKNEMVFSLIYRLLDRALFTAYAGEGAYKNGERVSVSAISSIGNAVIALSFQHIWFEEYHPFLFSLTNKLRSFQVMSSSAADSTFAAEGRLDGLVKVKQHVWDVAPECLLLQEAGAVVTDGYGNPLAYHFDKESKHSYTALPKALAENHKEDFYLAEP